MATTPKYIETQNGELLVFSHFLKHFNVRQMTRMPANSAGMVQVLADAPFEFFGNSVSLSLKANPDLTSGDKAWFVGTIRAEYYDWPIFATSEALLRTMNAKDIHPVQWGVIDECQVLTSDQHDEQVYRDFFMPPFF